MDVHIYLMYVQTVRICNGIKQAIIVAEEYKEYHKDYIEFWIELLKIIEKKINCLTQFIIIGKRKIKVY